MYGGPRPCKFGADCRNFQNGNCKFLHDPNTRPNMGGYPQPTGGSGPFGGPRPRPRPEGGNPFPTHTDNTGSYPPNKPKIQNTDISNQLCRMFHLGMQCKYGQKCNRKHSFLIKNPQNIRRFQMMRNLPLHQVSKLTKFSSGGKDYYAMRNNMDVNIFDFNIQSKVFNDVYTWHFPDPNGKFTFYDQKNEYIYFGRQNPEMQLQDLGFYNLQSQKNYFIQNAHRSRITGIAHFNQNIVLSTSMDGQLKVWLVSGQSLQNRVEETQKLKSLYNPQNANIEIYFIDISVVNGMKITSMGTSDGRIIFFLGDSMDYQFVALGYIESKVFQVRYTTRQGAHVAAILTWNAQRTHSSILEIDLTNGFKIRPLVELKTTSDQPKNTINLFEFVHSYLMVANLNGFVSIYQYPDTSCKVGGIHFQNSISENIIQSCDQLKTTNIKIKTMLILEKRTDKSEGSLGIFHIQ